MSNSKRVPFVGGPMDGRTHEWTTAKAVLVPDATDILTVVEPRWGKTMMLFGKHRYEMRCYLSGDERRYQLEHVSYTKPTVPDGCFEVKREG